jgi:hypothetical protein
MRSVDGSREADELHVARGAQLDGGTGEQLAAVLGAVV